MPWLARLTLPDPAHAIRDRSDLEAGYDATYLYVRPAGSASVAMADLRRTLPQADYFVVERERLRRPGERLPVAPAPNVAWHPLNEILPIATPAARSVSVSPAAVVLRVVQDDRGDAGGEADGQTVGLLTTLAELQTLVAIAPIVRFAGCRFAVDGESALVLGPQRLPIRGHRLTVVDDVAIEDGYRLEPAVAPETVRAVLDVSPRDIVLVSGDGVEVIPATAFVPLTRANVAATARRTQFGEVSA